MTIGTLNPLHLQIIHAMRQLSALADTRLPDQAEPATQWAIRVCTECRMLMGHALELKPNELHCCLKAMIPGCANGQPERVATWGRSEPLDGRPVETGDANSHDIGKNTVWSSLMGAFDGRRQWRPFPCFVCNDLVAAGGNFRCDRAGWKDYYKSALVFPIRYPPRVQSPNFINIGFLAFDSAKPNAFIGLPNIFDHMDDPTGFRDILEKKMAFNLGGIMADVLSVCLYPTRDDLSKERHDAAP
jgi:hypothetical protein